MDKDKQVTRLTKTDLQSIQMRLDVEAETIPKPTMDSLIEQGYSDNRHLNGVLDFVAGAGYGITLFVGEFAQAFSAIALMLFFILLEAERIHTGSMSLGLTSDKATLLAVAFTSANVILPIYRLRNVSDESHITETIWTVRGILEAFYRRLVSKPTIVERDIHHNGTLKLMEYAVTFATLFLAIYAVLGQQLARYADLVWWEALGAILSQSNINEFLQFVAGVLISVGSLFGVRTIAHEVGVRTTTKPQRLTDVLQKQLQDYDQTISDLRDRITQEHMQAKLADASRRKQEKDRVSADPLALTATGIRQSVNGNVPDDQEIDGEQMK